MSTSCIIALYSENDDEIVLLEKTHDGFLETVKNLITLAIDKGYSDLEELIEYLLLYTDIRYSIYSHKYPSEIFIYFVNENKYKTIKIKSELNKISECMSLVKKALKIKE